MPIPEFLFSVSALVCEQVLQEASGIVSAIRIVDIFQVGQLPPNLAPETLPVIQAYALLILKAVPGHDGEHTLRVRMINTLGEATTIVEQPNARFEAKPGYEQLPRSLSLSIQLNVGVKRYGTCYICLDLDGEEVGRTSFTLLQKQEETKAS